MKIGELAKAAGCTTETIRFYEKEGLLPAAHRNDANYRTYHERHVERLRFIRNCRAHDMTHDEIRTLLGAVDGPASQCEPVTELVEAHIRHLEHRIDELQQLKAQLAALRAQCKGSEPAKECGLLQGLASLATPLGKKQTHVG